MYLLTIMSWVLVSVSRLCADTPVLTVSHTAEHVQVFIDEEPVV